MRNFRIRHRRDHDLRDNFIRTKIMFALIFALRNHKELFERQLTFAFGSFQPDFRLISNENRNDGGRADKLCRSFVSQNGVVAVIAICDQSVAGLVLG